MIRTLPRSHAGTSCMSYALYRTALYCIAPCTTIWIGARVLPVLERKCGLALWFYSFFAWYSTWVFKVYGNYFLIWFRNMTYISISDDNDDYQCGLINSATVYMFSFFFFTYWLLENIWVFRSMNMFKTCFWSSVSMFVILRACLWINFQWKSFSACFLFIYLF